MEMPPIKYTQAPDGVHVAYYTQGFGPSVMLAYSPTCSHLHVERREPEMAALHRNIIQCARLVRFDHRGTGMSERHVTDFSIGACSGDIEAVRTASNAVDLTVFAFTDANQVAVAYAAHPNSPVTHLILWDPSAARLADDIMWQRVQAMIPLVDVDWVAYTEAEAQQTVGNDNARQVAAYYRRTREPDDYKRHSLAGIQMDVRPLMGRVKCPTLVVSTKAYSHASAQEFASGIPGAEYVSAADGTNHWLGASPERIWDIIANFSGIHLGDHIRIGQGSENPETGARSAGILSGREREVLALVAEGLTNSQIAELLVLSPTTVKTHVQHIIAKLGVTDRTQAAVVALERGWLHSRA